MTIDDQSSPAHATGSLDRATDICTWRSPRGAGFNPT